MAEPNRIEDAAGSFFGDATTALLRNAQALTGLQRELLLGAGGLWTAWARHQSEAVAAGCRILEGLYDSRNFGEIAQVQRNWLESTTQRTADILDKWTVESVAATRSAAASAESAMAAANEAMARTTERAAAE